MACSPEAEIKTTVQSKQRSILAFLLFVLFILFIQVFPPLTRLALQSEFQSATVPKYLSTVLLLLFFSFQHLL